MRLLSCREFVRAAAALSVVWLTAGAGRAEANLLVNGGFEDPLQSVAQAQAFTQGQTIPLIVGAWTVVGDPSKSIYLLQNLYAEGFNSVGQFNAQEGGNSVDLSGPFNVGPNCGVRQVVAVTAGREHTLSFYVGRVTPSGGPGGVYSGAATVDLSIDGGPRIPFTNGDVTNDRINWKRFSYNYTPAGNTMTIDFLNGTPVGTNETGLDDVSLDQVTPVAVLPGRGVIALSALLAVVSGIALARRARTAI